MFPRKRTGGLEAVVVNTAGGITGGDQFQIAARVAADCDLTLTTQACERAYRVQPGQPGRLNTALQVSRGGHLNWLPQETILFNGSHMRRSLRLNLETGASALVVEPLVFGRAAMGEELTSLRWHDRIEILRDGCPLFLDAVAFDGDMAAHLDRPNIAAGARAMALLMYVAADAEAHLGPLREMLPNLAGASLIGEDLLVLRLLTDDSFALRRSLIPILNRLTNDQLPKCWTI
ncbi:urease accessory protein UreD [Loktanella sp. IMCC34160]|uniref:urease accessory protein UreD n=1 Tax=Loktanella sp. IMCC34160 TaxID=2510646 RepID=UPI001F5CF49B|nr:urease accessory protein UreD [Loktanella sp. IMCC34160]